MVDSLHYHILQTCAAIKNDLDIEKKLYEMKQYGVELSDALQASKLYGFSNKCVSFVEYLVDLAIQIHHTDKPVQNPSKILSSYNPEKRSCILLYPSW